MRVLDFGGVFFAFLISLPFSCLPSCGWNAAAVTEGHNEGFQGCVEGGEDASGMGGRGRHGAGEHQQIIHQQLKWKVVSGGKWPASLSKRTPASAYHYPKVPYMSSNIAPSP